jgi:lipoprotein-anchoring transpeptidase ErfK/SrfK
VEKRNLARSTRLAVLLSATVALLVSACSSSATTGSGSQSTAGTPSGSTGAGSSPAAPTSTKPKPAPAKPVHVSGYPDGSTVGVGMPIIATFNKRISDAREFAKDTTVTVNHKVVHGSWYFELSDPKSGHVMEGHYRLQSFWPAHAHVHVAFNLKGVTAGKGLAFDGKLTSLDFDTGPRNVAVVNDANHTITVSSDGVQKFKFPVSLGASNTPTAHGIKVIMEKGNSICMSGPGYHECGIKYTQRLTYGGEYLHAAPWNTYNIGHGVDSSNGCTNMYTNNAKTLYDFMRIGDVVEYPNANGPQMSMGAGYGDWNVSWGQWQTGGAAPTA